mmetsp:Transcript_77821/g.206586  ORF Transcript_77821/g.206586 Transcript_77821/m.206586 type:complete len:223 (-) Transcript_77821:9-677(-)
MAFPTLADSLRAKEISMRESKPALSKVSSMSTGPAISDITSTSHSRKSPSCSSSTATRCPPSFNQSSIPEIGSHRGNCTHNASGQTAFAKAPTAADAVSTTSAPARTSRLASASSRGTQTTPPGPSAASVAKRNASTTMSFRGPATEAGRAGSTGVSSSMVTNTLPTWMPLEKYSNALCSSAIGKLVTGSLGREGSACQTSSRSLRHLSGCLSINTSKCAAA